MVLELPVSWAINNSRPSSRSRRKTICINHSAAAFIFMISLRRAWVFELLSFVGVSRGLSLQIDCPNSRLPPVETLDLHSRSSRRTCNTIRLSFRASNCQSVKLRKKLPKRAERQRLRKNDSCQIVRGVGKFGYTVIPWKEWAVLNGTEPKWSEVGPHAVAVICAPNPGRICPPRSEYHTEGKQRTELKTERGTRSHLDL